MFRLLKTEVFFRNGQEDVWRSIGFDCVLFILIINVLTVKAQRWFRLTVTWENFLTPLFSLHGEENSKLFCIFLYVCHSCLVVWFLFFLNGFFSLLSHPRLRNYKMKLLTSNYSSWRIDKNGNYLPDIQKSKILPSKSSHFTF